MTVKIFIPGRLASTRCPNKLIQPIGDTCLWEIACSKVKDINADVYVLTCDKELIDIAEAHGVNVIEREYATAHADSPTQYVFKDIIQINATHLMFLNPCFAFLTTETINKIVEDFELNEYDYATSVKPFHNYVFDKNTNPLTPIDYTNINTKSIDGLFEMAHCFHIFNKEKFFMNGQMLDVGHTTYEIKGYELIDVDTPEELEYVRYLYATRSNK
jgi:CMP-N-acetylneuraminic acid synthetase